MHIDIAAVRHRSQIEARLRQAVDKASISEYQCAQLVPYAGRFDGFHTVPISISKTCLVRFDNNNYSVAASAVGRRSRLMPMPIASSSARTKRWSASIAAHSAVILELLFRALLAFDLRQPRDAVAPSASVQRRTGQARHGGLRALSSLD